MSPLNRRRFVRQAVAAVATVPVLAAIPTVTPTVEAAPEPMPSRTPIHVRTADELFASLVEIAERRGGKVTESASYRSVEFDEMLLTDTKDGDLMLVSFRPKDDHERKIILGVCTLLADR